MILPDNISIDDLRFIAKEYRVPVRFVGRDYVPTQQEIDSGIFNASWAEIGDSAEESDITIGIYDDHELMVISFFHELAHVLTDHLVEQDSEYIEFELEAWKIGLEIAEQYEISFSSKAVGWALDQLKTYTAKAMRETIDAYAQDKLDKTWSEIQ